MTTNDSKQKSLRDVIVIGSGPAGYTAALYLARAELKPLVFAGESWGGQLMLTTTVDDYPGFESGIQGPDLMEKMRKQAARFGAEIVDRTASKVDFSTKPFRVWVGGPSTALNVTSSGRAQDDKTDSESLSVLSSEKGEIYRAKTVVIATGAESKLLGVPGEKEFMGRGVSTCAVCDAPFYKGKEQTYVVGGGDAAMEEALALAKYANRVGVIHRRDTLKSSKIMQRRVEEKKNVEFLWNSEVMEIKGSKEQNKATGVVVNNNKTGETRELPMDGIFIAIGHTPASTVFKAQIELDEKGYIVSRLGLSAKSVALARDHLNDMGILEYPTMTSVEGVFAAGDVVDFRYRQAVTAAGWGCMAAMDVEKFLTGTMSSW
ncbi:MAG: FAD-dependent oxidoreductase [Candidatus Chisholmbacteria bacterium]|nr:FAD-dependent oxidoreductase [Candidatus Chisholmbacteria bacterium]